MLDTYREALSCVPATVLSARLEVAMMPSSFYGEGADAQRGRKTWPRPQLVRQTWASNPGKMCTFRPFALHHPLECIKCWAQPPGMWWVSAKAEFLSSWFITCPEKAVVACPPGARTERRLERQLGNPVLASHARASQLWLFFFYAFSFMLKKWKTHISRSLWIKPTFLTSAQAWLRNKKHAFFPKDLKTVLWISLQFWYACAL